MRKYLVRYQGGDDISPSLGSFHIFANGKRQAARVACTELSMKFLSIDFSIERLSRKGITIIGKNAVGNVAMKSYVYCLYGIDDD